MKRCSRCKASKSLDDFHFDRTTKDGRARRCRQCASEHDREMKVKHGEKMRARRRALHHCYYAFDYEYHLRIRLANIERNRRRRADPNKNASDVARRYERIRNDPQQWEQFLRRRRECMARMRQNDPERYAAHLEARRVHRRLKRIDAGLAVRSVKLSGDRVLLKAAPLVPLIDHFEKVFRANNDAEKRGFEGGATQAPAIKTLAEVSGVSDRVIRRIRNGQENVSLDAADKLCHALGIPLAMIYDEGEE